MAEPRIIAALIGLGGIVLGWIYAAFLRRRDAQLRRAERRNDVQRALYAEIRAYVAVLERDDLDAHAETIVQRIRTEAGFFPLIPHERNDTIFRAIVAEIHVLPGAVIDPVTLYYRQVVAIQTLIGDLREIDPARFGTERSIAIYRDYIAMKQQARLLGREAMAAIGRHLGKDASLPDVPAVDGTRQ